MSVQLLQESLDLANEEDGIQKSFKKSKKSKKQAYIENKMQLLKEIALDLDFDGETGEIIRKKKKKQCTFEISDEKFLQKKATHGKLNQLHKSNQLKRNLKYMKYSEKRKLDQVKCNRILDLLSERDREKKNLIAELKSSCTGLREPNPANAKKKDDSVFTEEDFKNVGRGHFKMLGRPMAKFEKVKR